MAPRTKKADSETAKKAVKESPEVTAEVQAPAAEEAAAEPEKAAVKKTRKPRTSKAAKTEANADAPAKKTRSSKKTKAAEDVSPFDAIVAAAQKKAAKAKCAVEFAAQIDLTGDVTGTLYVECKDGNINVAGFDYKGHDLSVTADSDTFISLINGKTELPKAVESGKLEMTKAPLSTMLALKKILF